MPRPFFFLAEDDSGAIMLKMNEEQRTKQGFAIRRVSEADADAVTHLVNSISLQVSGVNEFSETEVESFWRTPGVDMHEDIRLLLSPEGEIVGYGESLTIATIPVHPFIFIRVRPEIADSDGPALLFDWAVERASRVLKILPADLRVSIATYTLQGFEPLQKLYESRGFSLTRHSFQMQIEFGRAPAPVVWPKGISVREFDAERHMEEVYLAYNESFSDHFGHISQPFEEGIARFRHLLTDDSDGYDPSLWIVAMDGDEVAGVSLCRPSNQLAEPSGWVSILGVRRKWRKQGLGMALLRHSFAEFYKRGWRTAGLDVDASSLTGALKLYERAGMHVARRFDRFEKELRPGKELMTTELEE
jgi:GNAT superfamily N-acetyltransferase